MAQLPGERDEEYWARMRSEFVEKQTVLMAGDGWDYATPVEFYRELFPEGSLEPHSSEDGELPNWDEDGGGLPNALALEITSDTWDFANQRTGRTVKRSATHRYTITDDLHRVDECDPENPVNRIVDKSLRDGSFVLVSPVTYFGKNATEKNGRYLHAFCVDLDGVDSWCLRNFLRQISNQYDPRSGHWVTQPQPSAIVNSGTGIHVYWFLDRPVPLVPKNRPFLKRMKRMLTRQVWLDSTSRIPVDKIQYQGIYQSFRMPGSSTKLNGTASVKKSNPYVATAYLFKPDGRNVWRPTLGYLMGWADDRGKGVGAEIRDLRKTGGHVSLEVARRRWPDWFQRIVVDKEPKGRWTCNRGLYDWWLRRVKDEASVGHRYWAVQALAVYADKCEIQYEELEADALALVPELDRLTNDPSNHFTAEDALAALSVYGTEEAHTYTRDGISRRTAIKIEANKRNGRKMADHVKLMNAARDIDYPNGEWRNGSGRKPKRDLVRAYAWEHPEANHSQIARELGVDRKTVIKWLRDGWRDEWSQEHRGPTEDWPDWDDEDTRAVIDGLRLCVDEEEISDLTGLDVEMVRAVAEKNHLVGGHVTGSEGASVTAPTKLVYETIPQAYETGFSVTAISEVTGVPEEDVRAIVVGSWADDTPV